MFPIVFLSRSAAGAAVLSLALSSACSAAQTPQQPAPAGEHHGAAPGHSHPPVPEPTNLKVLPKTLTGEQVHEIMHGWAGSLGVECNTCHAVDPNKKLPNGRPALNFADDSKKEKETARLMLKMTEDINKNYTSMVESKQHNEESAKQVTCGTCHRGHFDPPAYVPPPEHGHEHHDGSSPAGEKPSIPH